MKRNSSCTRNTHIASTVSLAWLVLGLAQAGAATIGYWRFEGGTAGSPATGASSILDSSGNGLNGTPANGPLYSSDLPSSAAGTGSKLSLQYNGYNQRVFVPDSPLLQLTHSLTIEAFVKTEPMLPGTGGGADILARGDTRPALDPYKLVLQQPGNILTFVVYNASDQFAEVSYTVPFDQWLHVAGTLDDATGQMKLYVNGNPVASTTTSIRPLGALDPAYSPGLGIGSDQTGQYAEYLNGWLDEVRLSDTALDPSQFLTPEPSPVGLAALGGAAALLLRRRRA
jgi:hypothetical protein